MGRREWRIHCKIIALRNKQQQSCNQYSYVDSFKKKGVDRVTKQFQAELADLQSKIKNFVDLASDTQMVYSAKFKFEPIVGETYHLYEGAKESFLSLIEPNSWKKTHLGSFRLNGDYKWERL